MSENQDHADVKIHPPILALLHIGAAFVLHRFFPLLLPFAYILPMLGGILVIVGLALGFTAIREFRRTNAMVDPQGSVSSVATNGPYRLARNPIYLGLVCMLAGFPTGTAGNIAFG